jgi:HEPN domain-containing protein
MAKDYLFRAERCLKEAFLAIKDEDAAGAIRRSQEALELAVKALLRLMGIEYPKIHDVGDVLIENADKLPEELKENIKELADLTSELASIRGPAFYGYEIEGVPASKAFKKEYAEETYKKVEAYIKVIYSFMLKHL